jgi:hypothetical protein
MNIKKGFLINKIFKRSFELYSDFFIFLFLLRQGLTIYPSSPGAHDPPLLASQMLGLWVWATIPTYVINKFGVLANCAN